MFASIAEFERDVIRERTMAGLEAARARGRSVGRPRSMDERKLVLASRLTKHKETPVSEVCEIVGVSKATLYRYVQPEGTRRDGGGLGAPEPAGGKTRAGEGAMSQRPASNDR